MCKPRAMHDDASTLSHPMIVKEQVDRESEELLREFRSKGLIEQNAIAKTASQISPLLRELQKAYLNGTFE